MKKRTKITLRTKIYLTIAGLATLAGVLYAANPVEFTTQVPFPTGVAAAPDLFLVSEYCSENIDQVDCNGNSTLFAQFPGFGSCREKYMTIAPAQAANAGFTPRDVYAVEGALVFNVHEGVVTLFAALPGCTASDHNGITFDHFGTFGNDMIVSCQEGAVFRVHGDGTVTEIANIFPPGTGEIEGPAVVPPGFGPHGGEIWVADEENGFIHTVGLPPTYTVTQNVIAHPQAEGVYVIPNPPCTICGSFAFGLAEQQLFQAVFLYPLSDFTGLGGNVIVTSEAQVDGADTDVVSFDGTQYVQTPFDPRVPGVNEGSSFVDCDVPTATPTTTPSATFTPTPTPTPSATFTPTPTATATFTPTATATFTPTATATFTPTPTATATATSTPTPTPTPTPTSTPPTQVSQLTPTGTTCSQFVNGTADTQSSLQYQLKNGVIHTVTPGVFFYWVKVTVPAGNNSFTITQTITTGNFTGKFDTQSGSNVFNSNCTSQHPTITQNTTTGAVTAQWNAPTAGTYIISIKYSSQSLDGDPAPSPGTTVHYNFATTGVPGSTSGLDLVKQ